MSKIVEKAFNATQRIIRAVFMGRPNLFTTSDLNRQIEAFKYQLDQLDDKVGVLTDMTLDVGYDEDTNTILALPTFTYLRNKGVEFAGLSGLVSGQQLTRPNVTDGRYYLCVVATTGRVTDGDDPSHEISGAKFEDGTSKPAAEHYIVRTANFYIYTAAQVAAAQATSGNIVFILANFLISNDTLRFVRYYVTDIKESAVSLSQESINIANDAVAIANNAVSKADAAREVADGAVDVCRQTATEVATEICQNAVEAAQQAGQEAIEEATRIGNEAKGIAQEAIEEATRIGNEAKGIAQDAVTSAGHAEEVAAQAVTDANAVFPVGSIVMWAGLPGKIPAHCHLCNGGGVPAAAYPELADIFGVPLSGQIVLPDLRGKFIVGYDVARNGESRDADDDYSGIGNEGGQKKVTLTAAQSGIRQHTHTAHTEIQRNTQGKLGGEHNHRWMGDDQLNDLRANWGITENGTDVNRYDAKSDMDGQGKVYKTSTDGDHTHIISTTIDDVTAVPAQEEHENRPPYYVLAYIIRLK